MLRTALDSHTRISCHDELLSAKYSTQINNFGVVAHLQSFRMRSTDGFVANSGIVDGGETVQQAIRHVWSSVELFSVPVIALHRRDLIRRAASDVIAQTTGVNRVYLQDKPNRTFHTLVMTPEQLLRSVDSAQRAFSMVAVTYQWAHVVVYEDLLTDWDNQMAKIFDYIGVPNEYVGAMTRRQEVRKIRDIVYNYEDLKSQLYGIRPELFDIAEQTDELFNRSTDAG
jgi:hypothetical protein